MEFIIFNAILQKTNENDISVDEKLNFMKKLIELVEKEGFESICYSKLASKEEAAKFVQKIEE